MIFYFIIGWAGGTTAALVGVFIGAYIKRTKQVKAQQHQNHALLCSALTTAAGLLTGSLLAKGRGFDMPVVDPEFLKNQQEEARKGAEATKEETKE